MNRLFNRLSTAFYADMLISSEKTSILRDRLGSGRNTFCSGLFLSARWFVFSSIAESGLHFIILPNKETAEYCAADLYNLIEGDCIFFLPER